MTKKKKWQILLPQPFVLDETITDEMIIDKLTDATDENEIASVFSSALQNPIEGYIVTCTEDELFDLLTTDVKDVEIEIQKYDDILMIMVNDLKGNLIGRGEITEACKTVSNDFLQNKFKENLSSFKNKYDEGTKRMNNLTYTLKTVSRDIKQYSRGKKSN